DGALRFYPGSPQLAADLLREQDRMILSELHLEDAATLREHFAGHPPLPCTTAMATSCPKPSCRSRKSAPCGCWIRPSRRAMTCNAVWMACSRPSAACARP